MICAECKIALTLVQSISGKCKCKNIYCSTHSFSKNHNCTFDYKIHNQCALSSNMPLVNGSKIIKL
jgi:predicted nucleic acid binding AN1-type Zn finger protein